MKKSKGRIKILKEGFGFMIEDNENIFFHANNLEGINFNDLHVDMELKFIVGKGKNGKQQAINIEFIDALINKITNDPSILEDNVKRTALLENISKLPSAYKTIFIFMLINILLPQINSISANLLTPFVENYIRSIFTHSSCDTEKNIPLPKGFNNYVKNDFRFITGDYVHLRKSQSTESKILGELQLGQVFKVLSQTKNWLEIEYTDNNDDKKYGWVSIRYTAKFIFYGKTKTVHKTCSRE